MLNNHSSIDLYTSFDVYLYKKFKQQEIMKASNEILEYLLEFKNDTSLTDIKSMIEGDRHSRSSCFQMAYAWSALMQLADEKGHFCASIIESALNGKFVSEKQAWVVAFFAKNNGLLNA